jgi:hypothetical protein
MTRAVLAFVAAALVCAGCGGGEPASTTSAADSVAIKVYWLRDGKVWPVEREVGQTEEQAAAALEELHGGPSGEEEDTLDAETALEAGQELGGVVIADGVASVDSPAELSTEAEAQVVYTLTQFSTVDSVEIGGTTVTRADYEDQTPSVLVDTPLAFSGVASPLIASGTANTFEATFSFEIRDEGGEVIAGDFVTATSGSGTRGTFRFAQPFVVDSDQNGTLVVFELSAEDGSRIHEVEIPLELRG